MMGFDVGSAQQNKAALCCSSQSISDVIRRTEWVMSYGSEPRVDERLSEGVSLRKHGS